MRRMISLTSSRACAQAIRSCVTSNVIMRSIHTSSFRLSPSSSSSVPSSPLYTSSEGSSSRFIFNKFISTPKTVAIVGAPMSLGQPQLGVDQGPAFIRKGGLASRLKADHWAIEDLGDVDFSTCEADGRKVAQKAAPHGSSVIDSPLALNSLSVGRANYLVYDTVLRAADARKFVLTLGGDHSIAVGTIAAMLKSRPNIGIIWVDAHADINTPISSSSKNIHGMVLAFLMNLDNCRNTIPGFEWMTNENIPILLPERLVYIGLRDLDWGEKQIIKSLNIKAYTMSDVDHMGIASVVQNAISHVINRSTDRPIHLTFDIDSIDPMYAPSTGTRVSGGLTYREAYYICEMAAETGKLASMDLVEVNPELNPEGQQATVAMAVGLCASALGNKIL